MFKVMTLNLNYYVAKHGPWEARRTLISDLIEVANPHVIALQAVREEPGVEIGLDQAKQLAGLLPEYRHVYFQAADHIASGDGPGAVHGSAFLSRVPFAETDCLPLTLCGGLEDTNRRVLLRARFDLSEGSLQLFNAHFSWVGGQAEENLGEALPYINAYSGPGLLVGDLNTLPDSELWQPLKAAGWADAWAALHPDQPGYTYESDRPYMRIDYAWANNDLEGRVKDVEVLTRDEQGVRLSDHAGLLVTLDL